MIKILITDDHPIVIRGLNQLIKSDPEMIVEGEAVCGSEALALLNNGNFDVVLLDITLPDINGFDLLKQINQKWPDLPVLILSVHPEEQYALRTIKAGASGYLTKNSLPDELLNAIRRVAKGKKYINPEFAQKIVLDGGNFEQPNHTSLSDREFTIFCMAGAGSTMKEIAESLSLSVKTVDTYKRRIYQKMGMSRISEIIRYCIINNLTI